MDEYIRKAVYYNEGLVVEPHVEIIVLVHLLDLSYNRDFLFKLLAYLILLLFTHLVDDR